MTGFRVANFKAVRELYLPLRHITLLTGANSSGKSSVVQALLFAIQSRDRERGRAQIALNGPLARLGTAADVIRSGATDVLLGFELQAGAAGRTPHRATIDFRLTADGGQGVDDNRGASPDLAALDRMRVAEVRLSLNGETIIRSVRESHVEDEFGGRPLTVVEAADEDNLDGQLRTSGLRSAGLSLRAADLADEPRVLETLLRHAGHVPGPVNRVHLQAICSAFLWSSGAATAGRSGSLPWLDDPSAFEARGTNPADLIESILKSRKKSELERVARDITRDARATGRKASMRLLPRDRASNADLDGVAEMLRTATPRSLDRAAVPAEALLDLIERAIDELCRYTAYLSGLRSEPAVLEALGSEAANQPLGPRGEHTGRFLSRYGQSKRKMAIPIGQVSAGKPSLSAPRMMDVERGVDAWARALGLASEIRVTPEGKLGFRVELLMEDAWRDFTEVGVGASQVIPIIVLVLGAPQGGTVVLEQPELHLHPAVQARLADFLAFARPDLSLIIETHSEYLLTRLRLRTAQGASEAVEPANVAVCFASPPRRGRGNDGARFRLLNLDRYGDLNAWPDGFFDAGEEDNMALLKAIAARRREHRDDSP